MGATYESDVIAWASEQACLLRAGHFERLDLERIAEEIEDVGKSEQREWASRMTVLIAHLLKWSLQPERQGRSGQITIHNQRRGIQLHLKQTPSLKAKLNDAEWCEIVWGDAVDQAAKETGLDNFPESCPWPIDAILTPEWLPTAAH
jgi:hypothetical protein